MPASRPHPRHPGHDLVVTVDGRTVVHIASHSAAYHRARLFRELRSRAAR
ncbi:hypothetical protein ACH4E7_44530 [Kitasatospora sp. NPDC018058]